MTKRLNALVMSLAAMLMLGACGGGGGVPPASGAGSAGASGAPQSDFARLVDAANREGTLTLWGQYPTDAEVSKVKDAFNARFKTNIQIQLVPMAAPDAQTRMVAEAQGNRFDWDVFPNFGSESLPDLQQRNLLAKIDWQGLFAKDLPSIKDADETVPAEFRGQTLAFYDGGYVFVFNSERAKAADVPQAWASLSDATYSGKFTASSFGYPFNYLSVSPDWGQAKTEQLVRAVAANKPLLQGATSQIMDTVVRGETPFGISDLSSLLDAQTKKKPADGVVPDYVPGDHRYTVVSAKAPHPNAARLYAAWEVSDGMKTFGDLRQASRFTFPNSALAAFIKDRNASAKIVYPQSIDDIKNQASFLKTAAQIYTQGR